MVAGRPSNRIECLHDGSAGIQLRAATLREVMQIILDVSLSRCVHVPEPMSSSTDPWRTGVVVVVVVIIISIIIVINIIIIVIVIIIIIIIIIIIVIIITLRDTMQIILDISLPVSVWRFRNQRIVAVTPGE